MKTYPKSLDGLYDPIEHAIISQWLGVPPPDCAEEVDLWDVDVEIGRPAVGAPIRLRRNLWGSLDYDAVENAVARLVLNSRQRYLPQWACVEADGSVSTARAYDPRRDQFGAVLARFLFEINWATSGPGYAWPEAYHLGYLPGYVVYVVSASTDSAEIFGYNDRILGHFEDDERVLERALACIQGSWGWQRGQWDQQRWQGVTDPGVFPIEALVAAADKVWADPPVGDEEPEAGLEEDEECEEAGPEENPVGP